MDGNPAAMTIRQWAMRHRALAGAGPQLAERVAQSMRNEAVQAIAEQRSVDGEEWEPRKTHDSRGILRRDLKLGPVLAMAERAISARGIGNVAVITLTGPEVFHHFGAGGRPVRRILPSKGIDKLGIAIARGVVAMCDDFMTRDGRHDRGGGGVKWKPQMGASG